MSVSVVDDAVPPPAWRLRPGRAWVLSLLYPGAGQAYVGAWTRGVALMLLVPALLAVIFLAPQYGTNAVHVLALLWCFAGADAFATAREVNRNMEPDAMSNPRMTAFLNASTGGWGYVYLGQRRGAVLVIALGMMGRALLKLAPVVVPLVTMATAIHGWRLASAERVQVFDELPKSAEVAKDPDTTIDPVVPLAVALVVAGCLYAVEIYAYVLLMLR
jgi:hypothetical protein